MVMKMGKRYKVIPKLISETGVSESTVKRRIKELGYTAEQVGESLFRYAVVNVLLDNKKAEALVQVMQRQADKIKVLEERPYPLYSEPEVDYKALYEAAKAKVEEIEYKLEIAEGFIRAQDMLEELDEFRENF